MARRFAPIPHDARLVIGGLWPTAPIRATARDGTAFDGVVVERNHPDTGWGVCGEYMQTVTAFDVPTEWRLDLRLPGPCGLGLAGLEWACKARTKGWTTQQNASEPSPMPEWFNEALGGAVIADNHWPWLSRYLAMADALAAARGWSTGEGAPVYGWSWSGQARRWLLSGEGYRATFMPRSPNPEITDPMEALTATWRKEVG